MSEKHKITWYPGEYPFYITIEKVTRYKLKYTLFNMYHDTSKELCSVVTTDIGSAKSYFKYNYIFKKERD